MHHEIQINKSIEEIMYDIKSTTDPVRKTILQEFLKLKLRLKQQDIKSFDSDDLNENEDDANDGNNGDKEKINEDNEEENENEDKKTQTKSKIKSKLKPKTKSKTKTNSKILNDILKEQEDSLYKLKKVNEMKAYQELLEENERESTQKIKDSVSSKVDPKYAKYVEQDHANNKLMERLNCEVDFRLSGYDNDRKVKIISPFETNATMNSSDNLTDTFASFEPIHINDLKLSRNGKNKASKENKESTLGKRSSLY